MQLWSIWKPADQQNGRELINNTDTLEHHISSRETERIDGIDARNKIMGG